MSAPETNEPRETTPDPQTLDTRYERLCAYVFGELTGEERAALEAELARDPELAAERERIAATAALVKGALPPEKLPDSIRATLSRAAARGPARRRFTLLRGGGGILRAAAALLVLLGGVFAWRAFQRGGPVGDSRDDMARAPHAKQADRDEMKDAGKIALGERARRFDDREVNALRALGYAAEESAPKEEAPSDALEQLQALGYTSSAPPSQEVAGTTLHMGLADSPQGAPAAASEDSSFWWVPGAPSSSIGAAAREESASPAGQYRGPGDSVPPGSSATSATGVMRRAGRAAMTRAGEPQQQDSEVLDELRGLGYVGGGGQENAPAPANPNLGLQGAFATPGASNETKDKSSLAKTFPFLACVTSASGAGPNANTKKQAKVAQEGLRVDVAQGQTRRPILSPEQVAAQQERMLAACRIQPGETPAMMFFRCWGDHPFVAASEDRLSTFGIDVDTASYTLARRYLNDGYLPRKAQVRTEEFVNYFRADAPAPVDGSTFAIGLEAAPSLFGGDPRTEMLRVTVRGKEAAPFERQPLALTFVVDNSGSMNEGNRLELVKESLAKLLGVLAPTDSVAVVVFSQDSRVLAPMTSAANRGAVEDLIASIPIEGGTNVEAGLTVGYEHALASLTPNAVNRVVLFSDGVGNIGETEAKALLAKVEAARKQGIYLNTFGVGMGNHDDAFLEELADEGDGLCQYLDSREEAERALVTRFAESMQPIARDVKIQVEFDPAGVERWRLLGYENRAIADAKFKDDTVDAGEVNAGHQVTALYEIVRTGASEAPFATVRVRFKSPYPIDRGPIDAGSAGARANAEAETATEIARSIGAREVLASFASASAGYRRSVLVAELAELLRRSVHARGDSRELLVSETEKLERELADPEITELAGLVAKALPLLAKDEDESADLQPLLDELARLQYERGQRELEETPLAPEDEEAATRRIGELEAEIRHKIAERHGVADEGQRLRELGYVEGNDR
jgi:Ca-activated chloride channel family protein